MKIRSINVYNLYPAIVSIRNSYKSWNTSDSISLKPYYLNNGLVSVYNGCELGDQDIKLIKKLIHKKNEYGHQERKFLRQIMVSMDIEASIKAWSQIDTYKVGTTRNSESTMHSLLSTKLSQDNFEKEINPEHIEYINKLIDEYNYLCEDNLLKDLIDEDTRKRLNFQKKKIFEQIDANLPAGFILNSHWTGNYENLRNIYHGRLHHKMYWWTQFNEYVRLLPYANILITDDYE